MGSDGFTARLRRSFTILIVPHNSEKVLNLQLSARVFLFAFALCVGFAFSVSLALRADGVFSSHEELLSINATYGNYSSQYAGKLRVLAHKQLEVLARVESMFASSELQLEETGTPKPISDYEELTQRTHQIRYRLAGLLGFLGRRTEVDKNLPMASPTTKNEISSPYGYRQNPTGPGPEFHQGVDFRGGFGSAVVATADAIVEAVGSAGGYGRRVLLRHEFGYSTLYAHLNSYAVKKGHAVERGDLIGYIGSSGRSTGAHLHYEVRLAREAIDPATFW